MHRSSGGHGEGVTPVPIPNTEVKPFSADGTAWVTVWESRTLPRLINEPVRNGGLFLFDEKLKNELNVDRVTSTAI